MKTMIFFILIFLCSLNVSNYLNLMSGISAQFGGNENIVRIQGMGMSGLVTNIIAFICTYFSEKINIKYQFLIYILFGDIFILYFIFLKFKFYSFCESNNYFSKYNSSFDSNDKDIELIEKNAVNKISHDQSILSYFENFKNSFILYFLTFICYFSTLACFPSLIFKFDTSDYINFRYKFIFITFIFNFGDITGRYLVEYICLSQIVTHIFTIIKVVLVYVCYLIVTYPTYSLLNSFFFKVFLIFLISLINGYNPCLYFKFAQKKHFDSPINMMRVGEIYQYSVQFGLFFGALFSIYVF